MKKIIVKFKADAKPVFRNPPRNHRKPSIHTVAAVFRNYLDALTQADLIFEVFSDERREAQRVALNRLEIRLNQLNVTNIDWNDAYANVVKYAVRKEAA